MKSTQTFPSMLEMGVATQDQVNEYMKCYRDPSYFFRTYLNLNLYPSQEEVQQEFSKNRFVMVKKRRMAGASTLAVAHALHTILFNERKNIALLGARHAHAQHLLAQLKNMYTLVPEWMRQGVLTWNKGNIELENGSKVMAASLSSSSMRGNAFNMVIIDEMAFAEDARCREFFNSVYPTVTSGAHTKCFILSTSKPGSVFDEMWDFENQFLKVVMGHTDMLSFWHDQRNSLLGGSRRSTLQYSDEYVSADCDCARFQRGYLVSTLGTRAVHPEGRSRDPQPNVVF